MFLWALSYSLSFRRSASLDGRTLRMTAWKAMILQPRRRLDTSSSTGKQTGNAAESARSSFVRVSQRTQRTENERAHDEHERSHHATQKDTNNDTRDTNTAQIGTRGSAAVLQFLF
jgi:hypothetical protein